MFEHIILISYRNFLRDKSSFLINLFGLSMGLACALFIYLWVVDETNVDKFHEKDSQLYQIMNNFHAPDEISTSETTPVRLSGALADEMPEVEATVIIMNKEDRPEGILTYDENQISARGLYTSKNFFEEFSFPLRSGNSAEVLAGRNQIVLSEGLAAKLFQSPANAVGKIIEWKNQWEKGNFEVTGVFEDPPASSTLKFDFVFAIEPIFEAEPYTLDWDYHFVETYLVLGKNTDISKFNKRISAYLASKDASGEAFTLFAQKYSDRYLHGSYENGVVAGGRISYVRLFSLIALFILLIACINFMNLSTAQAAKKMREIGVKKALGASRSTLVAQFLTESLLITFLSAIFAVLIVVLLLPQFNHLTDKALELSWDLKMILSVVGIALLTGLLAGSYPAFYLSSFDPVGVMKRHVSSSASEKWIRRGLVIFQYSLSVIFIVGVLIINRQMEYIQTKNLGYNRDNVLGFYRPSNDNNAAVLLTELDQLSGVQAAANMNQDILSGAFTQNGYSWRGEEEDKKFVFKSPIISYGVIETLGMKVLQGRSFSPDFQDDSGANMIINEAALKLMQLDEPIGHVVEYGRRNSKRQIIGVVSDFHYGSIHHKIEPLIFRFSPRGSNFLVKIKAGSEQTTIQQIGQIFKKFYPEYPFEYSFLDADYQALYKAETRVSDLSKYFSILAIIISCLGILGLATFTAEQRKKEIGIRRALGQSAIQVSVLLSREFAQLVLVAILIGLPLAYYFTKNWLSSFAYKIDLSLWYFLLAGMITLVIALVTVSTRSIQAAYKNPVDALRDE